MNKQEITNAKPTPSPSQLAKRRITEAAFLSYASRLRLTEPVRLAIFDVLVVGKSVESARFAYGVSRAAVYRAIGQLFKRRAPKLARVQYDVPEHRASQLDAMVKAQLDVWLELDEEEAARADESLRNADVEPLTETGVFNWD